MPDTKASNAKIYDRPERKGPSPVLVVVILLILALAAFFAYRTFTHAGAPARQGSLNHSLTASRLYAVVRQESNCYAQQ